MPTAPGPRDAGAIPPSRDRGDACPGTLRLHAADDGALARVRIPAGALTTGQALALWDAAQRLGDGSLHLTSRGNVQLRGLAEDCGGELADVLGSAGLLPSPRHERVRNVVASPLSGLDGRGEADVQPWVRELDRLLCASEAATGLSGRFLFALDDGRGDVAALGADVTVQAAAGGTDAVLRLGSDDAGVSVRGEDAPRAALLAAEAFLDAARGSATRCWRVSELPGDAAELMTEVASRLAADGINGTLVTVPPTTVGDPPRPGAVAGPDGRTTALSVVAPLGVLTAAQWHELAAVAEHDGNGELRLTPWRGVILAGVKDAAALETAGLITSPASPWLGVGACVGRPGCAKSLADVRTDAAKALGPGPSSLPVYWSGCERRCGHPHGDWVDVVATADGYDVRVHGDKPCTGMPPSELAAIVAAARTSAVTR
ncbi:precorrin-3B synthase [Streptomyces sp. NBC_00322]|uniref:precorrin-3B synthase n=1 Tax=Streptomyces sp. NBC_00322 TaxID=2975712 RepID=UPI002E2BCB6F|nr:precorrin-3B synthase [Streptomyces sp. NBC_00322]